MLQDLQPADFGHLQIRQDEVDAAFLQELESGLARVGLEQVVALRPEDQIEQPPHLFLIFNDQNRRVRHARSFLRPIYRPSAGSRITTSVPFPSWLWIASCPPFCSTSRLAFVKPSPVP